MPQMALKIKRICVCGAGTMGSGIAQVTAMAGYDTILYELNSNVLQKAPDNIQQNLSSLIQKGKISEKESQSILKRIQFTSDISICQADLIIEAIVEIPEVKVDLFNRLAEFNQSVAIFASNTSSLSISALAERCKLPTQVAGLHFFNPAPFMKLVEVIRGRYTSDAVIDSLIAFTKSLGKTPVICKDAPGFIVNRVARPYYIESLRIAEQGMTSFEVIDSILEDRGFKMGPFKLMDLIGNDINYAVSCSVYDQLNQPERLRPSLIQKEKVEKGELGRKSKKGYYPY